MTKDSWWRGDWMRLGVALVASVYFTYYASTPTDWHFIDSVNLIIHEAGHWIFLPFGEFMNILGGSLFQCLFPLIYIGYFIWKSDNFSASLLGFWFGQNLINVSVYASDALTMQLPLLGGDSVIHDWNYILGALHQLQHSHQIGYGLYSSGVLIMLLAAVLAFITSQVSVDQPRPR